MSSLKMTFSLTSLILIIAFGFVFGITSVEAHESGRAHPHPLNEALTVRDLNNDGDNDDVGEEAVAAHNTHPTATITLKEVKDVAKGSEAIVTAAAATFTIVIDFDVDVVSANNERTVAGDTGAETALGLGDFTSLALNANGVDISNAFTIGVPTRVDKDDSKWEAVVTVNTEAIPTGDAELKTVTTRFQVNAGAVFSLEILPDQTAVPGTGNYASPSPSAEITLVQKLTPIVTPDPDPVMFAVSGMASLSAPFTVTFTSTTMDDEGDLVGAMLAMSDIEVSSGDGFVVAGTLNDTSPSDAPMTEWQAIIQPVAGATSITVTIADNKKTAPAADEDNGILRIAGITLVSIAAAEGADDTGPFVVTLTFSDTVDSLTMDDLMVSPYDDPDTDDEEDAAEVSEVNAVSGTDMEMWTATITPVAGMATKVALAEDSNIGMGSVTALTVKTKAAQAADDKTPTAGDVTAAYDATKKETTISDSVIGANGFAVIDYSDLPDLELFFDIGGTITLHDNDTADDKNSRAVVMSEILWGLDFGEVLERQKKHQFIELYNTTAADIDLDDWKFVFTAGNVRPASDIDQVSNRGPGGWEVDTGDTGKSGRVTGTLADDLESTITPVNIISMYRNINYDKVEKVKADGTADPNRDEQLKGIPGGNGKGSWKNSIRRSENRWVYSTPGAKHHTTTGILSSSSVAGAPFRINEIGNDTGGENDWVEIHNLDDAEKSLKNYSLSMVTAKGTDTRLFHFHDQDWKVPGKGFIVISTQHPRDTDLATGKAINIPDDEELNKGLNHLYAVKSGWNLQDDGKFTLILRNAHDKHGKAENLIDVVATRQGAFSDTNTRLWPLKLGGFPHENVIDAGDENFAAGKVYQRNKDNGRGEKHFAVSGYTGIGYDVKASKISANHGTPGYSNGAAQATKAGLTDGVVTISEIMIDVGHARRNLPQWIELHNSSDTMGVNLAGWKLHIENAAQADGDLETNTFSATVTIGAKYILPNQALLIASSTGNVRNPDHFPPTRVINLWTTKAHRDALETTRSTDPVLSTRGFNITLVDKDGAEIDEVGNLDGDRRTRDEPAWTLPVYEADDDQSRSSLLRVYDDKVALDGTMAASWILASDTILAFEVSHAYYGNADDVGSPGYRTGGPLPVSLSKFRPERLKDTGEIVVRWITESELNNAGFNILRSETRNGQFTQINTSLIAGQGTTSERTTYEWKDSTAKPNVVYYYQIQDVSLDGNVQILRQSRLKGNVSAAGKITTTWGELKALQ